MRTLVYGLASISLFHASFCYAVDCSTSFDQSCLSGEYNSTQVQTDYREREQKMDTYLKAVREEEEEIAKEEEKFFKAEEKERRHQERLAVEEKKAAAERQQIQELQTIQNQLQAIEMQQYWQHNR